MSWATTAWPSTPNRSACSSPEHPPLLTQPSPGPTARSFSLRETSTGEWTSCWQWSEDTPWARRSAGCAVRAPTLEGSRSPGVDVQWPGITDKISLDPLPKQADFILFYLLFRMTELYKLHHNLKEKSRTFYSRWHVCLVMCCNTLSQMMIGVSEIPWRRFMFWFIVKTTFFLIQIKKCKHWTWLVWFLNICLHKNSSNIHNNKSFICSALWKKKKR